MVEKVVADAEADRGGAEPPSPHLAVSEFRALTDDFNARHLRNLQFLPLLAHFTAPSWLTISSNGTHKPLIPFTTAAYLANGAIQVLSAAKRSQQNSAG
jgi:hypothetical protein